MAVFGGGRRRLAGRRWGGGGEREGRRLGVIYDPQFRLGPGTARVRVPGAIPVGSARPTTTVIQAINKTLTNRTPQTRNPAINYGIVFVITVKLSKILVTGGGGGRGTNAEKYFGAELRKCKTYGVRERDESRIVHFAFTNFVYRVILLALVCIHE